MIGSPEMAGYLLVQGLSLVSVLLTFALWAAVIWWLARSRHGDTLGLAPLLALGVVVLMDLVDPARRSEERRVGKGWRCRWWWRRPADRSGVRTDHGS